MKDFNSVEELYQEILADKEARLPLINRYPIRLIFFPSFHMLREFVKLIDTNSVKKVELADFLSHDDGWLTVEGLINEIKRLNEDEDLIILPLSEIARFYSHEEFSSLFNALSDIENNKTFNRRIYIPLVGIYERFKDDFFDNFYRKDQWAPIWIVQSNDISKITIQIVDFHLNHLSDIEIIYNTKDWLNIWKRDEIESLICISKTLKHRYPNRLPDQMFDIEEIKNHKEFLSKIYGIPLPMDFNEDDRDYWDKLTSIIIEKSLRGLDEITTEIFGTSSISKDEILRLWDNTHEKFKKWLLRQYIISNNEWHDTYIYRDVHSTEPYRYPDSIIKGIEIIKKILQRNLILSKGEKVAIVSDHGSTALARLKENLKIYDFKNAHHDGRCMWLDRDCTEYDELLIHTIDKPCSNNNLKALIALRYTSLYRKPVREVHGGATPEEVLVPVIIVSRRESMVQYEINIHSEKISRRSPILGLTINPFPNVNPILIDKYLGQIHLEYNSEDKRWKADLRTFKAGKYKMTTNVKNATDISKHDFEIFCLKPAMEKRGIIRKQISMIDSEFKEDLPDIKIKS